MSGDRSRLMLVLIVLAVIAAAAVGVTLARSGGDDPADTPTEQAASDAPTTEPAITQTPSPTEAATTPAPVQTAAPSEEPTALAQPTDTDVAAFVDAEGPADRTAAGDVTGDGVDEVVLAGVRNNTVQITVGLWDGSAYQRVFRDEGGPATRLLGLEVVDYNAEAGAEIVTEQGTGSQGRSISVWGPDDGGVVRQTAVKGCWDGFHTYGTTGVTIEAGRITASCSPSTDPAEQDRNDVYEWRRDAWRYLESTTEG